MSIEMYRLRTVVVWQYVLKSIEILHLCMELMMVIFFIGCVGGRCQWKSIPVMETD